MSNQVVPQKYSSQENYIYIEGVKQPRTHFEQKGIKEKVFMSCYQNNDLSEAEVRKFIDLQLEYEAMFDKENPKHVQFVKRLYELVFKEQCENMENEDWKTIGFQGKNPATDFRGGGLQSLRDIIYLFENNNSKYIEIFKNQNQSYDFLLAILSINLSFFFKNYFHLNKELNAKKDNDKICRRVVLKNFCRALEHDFEILKKVHNLSMKILLNKWISHRSQNVNSSLMDLEFIKKGFLNIFKKYTELYFYIDFEQFKQQFIRYLAATKYLQEQDCFLSLE